MLPNVGLVGIGNRLQRLKSLGTDFNGIHLKQMTNLIPLQGFGTPIKLTH